MSTTLTTITVTPDTAKILLNLQARASEKGIPLEELRRSVSEQFSLTPLQKAAIWETWANNHSFNQAVIPDDSRETFYSDEN